jgi:hypothetical protein
VDRSKLYSEDIVTKLMSDDPEAQHNLNHKNKISSSNVLMKTRMASISWLDRQVPSKYNVAFFVSYIRLHMNINE